VTANAALPTVPTVLGDAARYQGAHRVEVILVINNYPTETPPPEIESYRELGMVIVGVADVNRPGITTILNARAQGVPAAASEVTLHFDADCRIPDIDAVLDWYVHAFRAGAQLAYTRVEHYGLPKKLVTRFRQVVHRTSRWTKRVLLRVPTARGSNYAISRSLFQRLYDEGQLQGDIQVGPRAKLAGGKVAYSGKYSRRVLTSGRKQSGSWVRLIPYLFWRLQMNLKAIPTRRRKVEFGSFDGFDREVELRRKQNWSESER
jgi:hypothetical protein